MDVEEVVKLFKSIGAKCKKLRRREIYSCWKDGVRAVIDPEDITITDVGEFREEYLHLETEDGWRDLEIEDTVSNLIGGKFRIEIRGDVNLKATFPIDRAEDAVKLFNYLAENEVWMAATNMDGELRIRKGKEAIGGDEFIEDIEKLFS